MSDRIKALREKRGTLTITIREIMEAAKKRPEAQRDLTAEEAARHEAVYDEWFKAGKQIEAEERQIEVDREAASRQADTERVKSQGQAETPEARVKASFRSWLGGAPVTAMAPELRALQSASDVDGGFLRPPLEFVAELIKAVDNAVYIRKYATKYQVTQAVSLGVPTLDTDVNDADWTTELATGTEDTAMKFGRRDLTPHPLAKLIKISKKLLRSSAIPVDQVVMDRFAYKFGVTQEKGFMTGNGSNQPLGLFTASAMGIPTSQDVSTGNSTTAMTFDGLINAKMSLKPQHWNRSTWVFHRDGIKQLLKLKDGDGQYIWRQSVREGEPDVMLGRPIINSEYAPNTFTTGLYVGLFGDLSNYWIVDALDMQMQRLVELYAATNQDGFIGRQETDGMPVLAEAFARVTLA